MGDVVNKTTLQYLKSVNTPDYSETDWLINPKIPSCEQKYWRIASGQLKEMTTSQKNAVDQAEADLADTVQAETYISDKITEQTRQSAIDELVTENKLNPDGTLKK